MRDGSLSRRLAQLREARKRGEIRPDAVQTAGTDLPVRPDSAGPEESLPAGEARVADGELPAVWEASLRSEGWVKLSRYVWKKTTLVEPPADPPARSILLRCELEEPGSLLFFDTETTGLSGGAGNHVFLIGLGRIVPGREHGEGYVGMPGSLFRIDQYFLSDFPGEPEFLSSFKDELCGSGTLVSYNGKAFDCSILSTRFLMNGMRPVFGRHLDLLYPSRFLWRSLLPSCGLQELERSVLSITRTDDVPGSEVPEVYFRFLRTGDTGRLLRVFLHNRLDIEHLFRLFLHTEELLRAPGPAPFADRYNLGRLLLKLGAETAGEVLRAAWEDGNLKAGRLLGHHLRRSGRFDEAAAVWNALFSAGKSLHAGIELAKHLEHRLRDCGAALAVVDRILSMPHPLRSRHDEELRRRRDRLVRKLSRGSGG